jgi:hypothetical protein
MSEITSPVLIVAFKRAENVREILRLCKLNGIRSVYVVVDGPRSTEDVNEVKSVHFEVLNAIKDDFFQIKHFFRDSNVGCSASVVSACDWFFSEVEYGAVLEDDCLPSKGFFTFVDLARGELFNNPKIALACGTQLLSRPGDYSDSWILSRYAFHWGWSSTSESWFKSMSYLVENPPQLKEYIRSLRSPEYAYWFAGARRAFQGYADVWDSLISNYLFMNQLFVLLPTMNLVSNLGDDQFATHTAGNKVDTKRETCSFILPSKKPDYVVSYDVKAKITYFKIRSRHIFTTTITFFRDYIGLSPKLVPSFTERRHNSQLFTYH